MAATVFFALIAFSSLVGLHSINTFDCATNNGAYRLLREIDDYKISSLNFGTGVYTQLYALDKNRLKAGGFAQPFPTAGACAINPSDDIVYCVLWSANPGYYAMLVRIDSTANPFQTVIKNMDTQGGTAASAIVNGAFSQSGTFWYCLTTQGNTAQGKCFGKTGINALTGYANFGDFALPAWTATSTITFAVSPVFDAGGLSAAIKAMVVVNANFGDGNIENAMALVYQDAGLKLVVIRLDGGTPTQQQTLTYVATSGGPAGTKTDYFSAAWMFGATTTSVIPHVVFAHHTGQGAYYLDLNSLAGASLSGKTASLTKVGLSDSLTAANSIEGDSLNCINKAFVNGQPFSLPTTTTSTETTQNTTIFTSTTMNTSTSTNTTYNTSTTTSFPGAMPMQKPPEQITHMGLASTRLHVADDSSYTCKPGTQGDKLKVVSSIGIEETVFCVAKGSLIVQPALSHPSLFDTSSLVVLVQAAPTTMATSTNTTATTETTTLNRTIMHLKAAPENYTYNGQEATRLYVPDDGIYTCHPTNGDKLKVTATDGTEAVVMCIAKGSLIVSPRLPANFDQFSTVSLQSAGTGVTPPVVSSSAGGDPVAWFGKESREFWLPVGKLTPILHTQHLSMLASTFVGSPREQWMDRIVVTNADGFRLADIRIKKDLLEFNRSKVPPNSFETLDLTLGMGTKPLKELPKDLPGGNKKVFSRMDVSVVVDKLSQVFLHNSVPFHLDQTHIGKARREAVIVTSPHARFLIISSPATEYYGDIAYLSVEYAHLDIHILDMKNRGSIRGLLPELWGFKKMSNRTKELTCPPWSKDASARPVDVDVDVDAAWNKRFVV